MSKPIIEVSGLSKCYRLGAIGATSLREEFGRFRDRLRGQVVHDDKEFWALRDVSFDVQPGEVVGVIGRNGAGKSTLLKILSRITEPTAGKVTLRGRVASLLEVGTGFHPELTGRENVYLNGAILGMTRAEVRRKFDEIVAFAEVEQFIDTPVKRYSSGMYVRLAFAVAAHLEPEILIVDEVLAVGDSAFQKKCLGRMEEVSQKEGRTVFFVSHRINTMQEICQTGVLLQNGRLLQVGPIADVAHAYLSDLGGTPVQTASNIVRNIRWSRHLGAGQPFWLELEAHIPPGIAAPHYRLTFYSESGDQLAVCGTHLRQSEGPPTTGPVLVRFEAPSLPLLQGNYQINLSVCDGESGHTVLERIENAAPFRIAGPGPFALGRWPERGVISLEHSWRVAPLA